MSKAMQAIHVAEAISPDLMLRGNADAFFDRLERMKTSSLTLDFTKVESISRSFAHQYIQRKRASSKTIKEANMPTNVTKMLELVERSSHLNRPRSALIDLDRVKIITI